MPKLAISGWKNGPNRFAFSLILCLPILGLPGCTSKSPVTEKTVNAVVNAPRLINPLVRREVVQEASGFYIVTSVRRVSDEDSVAVAGSIKKSDVPVRLGSNILIDPALLGGSIPVIENKEGGGQ